MTDDSENETDDSGLMIKLDKGFVNTNSQSSSGMKSQNDGTPKKTSELGGFDLSIFGGVPVQTQPAIDNGLNGIFGGLGNLNLNPVINDNNNNNNNNNFINPTPVQNNNPMDLLGSLGSVKIFLNY